MKLKKIICVAISTLLISSSMLGTIAFADKITGTKTVIELTDEELENGRTFVWDWYKDAEPMCRWKTARARVLNPDGWNEIADKLIYASNGQFAHRTENFDLIIDYWNKTKEKGDDRSFVLGDLDKSGTVDVADARIALRLAVGLDKLPDNLRLEEVDVSINDSIGVEDARLILRTAVGFDNARSLDIYFD